ncbi:MAG TPA: DUF2314 domain-containing protein [Gemmataceae bacterium]|nr:DUF2314 domain-containing protein [Gemmataceae bacterium]
MGSYSWLNRWSGGWKANRPEEGAARAPLNRPRREEPPASLVLLQRQPRDLDTAVLARAAAAAFGLEVAAGESDTGACVVGESPHFLVQLPDRLLAVHNAALPYFDNPVSVAATLPELRLREAVARHRAWVSLECLHADPAAGDPYDSVARLAAALLDTDSLALCVPARRRVYVCEDSVPGKLRGPDPLTALDSGALAPVVGLSPNDPRLLAAVREARRRWPEFVAAFEQRESGQLFSVKVPVREGKQTEYMWLSVSALEHEMIYGRLDNEPVNMKRLRPGDRLRVPVRDLNDWLYTRGETLTGGFTIEVLANSPKRPHRP